MPRGVNLRDKLNDKIMIVVKTYKNTHRKLSLHGKAIYRMPIGLGGGTLEITRPVQSNYVLNKILFPLFY